MQLGTDSAPAKLGWEQRFNEFIDADPIRVSIHVDTDRMLAEGLMTPDDVKRNRPKLEMVERLAKKLAINMTKGTFKYNEDEWQLGRWLHMGIDDAMDGLLYMVLAQDRATKDGTL